MDNPPTSRDVDLKTKEKHASASSLLHNETDPDDPSTYERTYAPPQAIELEQILISEILSNPSLVEIISPIISPSDFECTLLSDIYTHLMELYSDDNRLDFDIMIHKSKHLYDVDFLRALSARSLFRSAERITMYAEELKKVSLIREMSNIGSSLVKMGEGKPSKSPHILLGEISDKIQAFKSYGSTNDKNHVSNCGSIMHDVFERLTSLPEKKPSVNSGFYLLDQMTGGFHNGDFILLAARPSMGKTALALTISHSVIKTGKSVLFFSLEMSKEQLGSRMVSSHSGIDLLNLRNGDLSNEDWPKVGKSIAYFSEMPFHVNDSSFLSCAEILNIASNFKSSNPNGLHLIIIDYLQMIAPTKEQNRYMEISNISRDLKKISKDLDVPLLVLSQLNRNLEQRADKHPTLSDLRDSGALEQDADLICFVYRDFVYNPSEDTREEAEIVVAKHRNGPTGTVKLNFLPRLATFYNYRG